MSRARTDATQPLVRAVATTLARLVAVLVVLALAAVVVAGCGSDDDSKGSDDREARTTTSNSDDDPSDTGSDDDGTDDGTDDTSSDHEAGDDPDASGGGDGQPDGTPAQPIIQVRSPAPLSYVSGAFVLAGTAQVFEGDLRWAILDSSLEPMVQGRMTASCGAPCRGTFRARIPLRGVELGSWELHVWAPPVDDDDPARMHDTMVPITVTDQPVESVPLPEPGA